MQDVAQTIRDVLDELRGERDRLNEQIESLGAALAAVEEHASRPRRGRPKRAPAAQTKQKPAWSSEAKEAARKRMKKYWADRKKAEAAGDAKPARTTKATTHKTTKKKVLTKKPQTRKA